VRTSPSPSAIHAWASGLLSNSNDYLISLSSSKTDLLIVRVFIHKNGICILFFFFYY